MRTKQFLVLVVFFKGELIIVLYIKRKNNIISVLLFGLIDKGKGKILPFFGYIFWCNDF